MNLENYEQYALDYLEGGLTPEQKLEFERFLELHPQIKDEIEELAGIQLVPDPEVKYPDKEILYRKGEERSALFFRWSVAAAIFLLIGVGLFFRKWEPVNTSSDRTEWIATTGEESVSREDDKNKKLSKESEMFPVPETTTPSEKLISAGPSDHVAEANPESSPAAPVTIEVPREKAQTVMQSQKPWAEAESEIAPEIIDEPAWAEVSVKKIQPIEKIALSEYRLEYNSPLQRPIIDPGKKSSSRVYSIYLPDELFSETWGDLSLNEIKERIIPEFFKIKSK